MNWQKQLQQLEDGKCWDQAIALMEIVLAEHPDSLQAYLRMLYLLMNLLVEEDYDDNRHDYYASLTLKYFKDAWAKFSESPEFLYYVGRIGVMSPWYFNLDRDDVDAMVDKAAELEPENLIYKWNYYRDRLSIRIAEQCDQISEYAKLILQSNSPIKSELLVKGSLGVYIWEMMDQWAKGILSAIEHFREGKLTALRAFRAVMQFIKERCPQLYEYICKEKLLNSEPGTEVWMEWCRAIDLLEPPLKPDEVLESLIRFLRIYNEKLRLPELNMLIQELQTISSMRNMVNLDLLTFWDECVNDALHVP